MDLLLLGLDQLRAQPTHQVYDDNFNPEFNTPIFCIPLLICMYTLNPFSESSFPSHSGYQWASSMASSAYLNYPNYSQVRPPKVHLPKHLSILSYSFTTSLCCPLKPPTLLRTRWQPASTTPQLRWCGLDSRLENFDELGFHRAFTPHPVLHGRC